MKRLAFFGLLLAALPFASFAQDPQQPGQPQLQINCTQSLRTARSTYDQGRLHEVTQWLTGCITKPADLGGFTDAERIEAHRMLTLTYIYLEEPDKADAEMINLLNTEHFYMIDDDVDPIEFKNLYKKFRIDPVFRWGVKGAVNTTQVSVLGNRYVWSASANKGSYKSNMTVNYGVAFEKDLNLMQKRFVLAPEFLLTQSKFTYSNTEIMFVDEQVDQPNHGEVEGIITQSRLQLNALVQFKIDKQYIQPGNYFNLADKFIPYVTIGPSISYLTESGFDGTTNADEQISGSTVDNTDSYNPLMFSVILGAGTKFRFGGMYLSLELRHQYGFGNVVNTDNLYDNKELMSYGYVDNDFRLGQTSFNVGIMFPRFNPKKLIK